MSPHQLKRLFPNASASVLAANASDFGSGRLQDEPQEPPGRVLTPETTHCAEKPVQREIKGKRRKVMNKTEAAFSLRLMAEAQTGTVLRWDYEGLTLRWGTLDNIQYTPDFAVFRPDKTICLIETKGGHIWPKDIQKFKAARNEWPQFRFEMWQLKKGQWTQLY